MKCMIVLCVIIPFGIGIFQPIASPEFSAQLRFNSNPTTKAWISYTQGKYLSQNSTGHYFLSWIPQTLLGPTYSMIFNSSTCEVSCWNGTTNCQRNTQCHVAKTDIWTGFELSKFDGS